jgi:uncharacterized protein with NRDE domain
MCLLALFFRVVPDAALVAGANREEAYARGGEPPQLIEGRCSLVAGLDPVGKGTWFGVNQHGVFAAVTNRSKSHLPAKPRSRGLLTKDLLFCTSAKGAMDVATRELDGNRYAGCNIICAARDGAYVVHAGDWLRVRPLPPGLHVITASDVNDSTDKRIAHSLTWLAQRTYVNAEQCLVALQALCRQTGNGGPPICLRGTLGGTVSSSLLAVRNPLGNGTYLHCQGPSDSGRYADYSHLLAALERCGRGG